MTRPPIETVEPGSTEPPSPDLVPDGEGASGEGADAAVEPPVDIASPAPIDSEPSIDVGPDTVDTEAAGPGAVGPDVTEPETSEPDAIEPGAVEPEAVAPDAIEPEVVEPGAAVPDATGPEVIETDATEPEAVEQDAGEPDGAEPEASEPEAVEPEAVEPEAVEPEAIEPEAIEPEAIEPEAIEPEAIEPEAVEPEAIEPEAIEPEAVEPEAIEPEAIEPEAVEPEAVEPEASEPEAIEPDTDEPAAATDGATDGKGARADFRLFNTMLYANMPRIGMRMPVVYEQAFFGANAPRADAQPSDAGIAEAVANARNQYAEPWHAESALVVADIERWHVWPFVSDAAHELSVSRYAGSMRRFRAALGQPVCLYAIAPQSGINHAILSTTNAEIRADWTEASDVTGRSIVPHVDALCPSLYTYYGAPDAATRRGWIEGWKTYALETIREARRLAPDKPVYPFIWPQYHGGGNVNDFSWLQEDYWRAQIELMRDHADGLILWGGWDFTNGTQLPWNADAAWYRILREYFPDL